ncbi:MAG: sensor histidine kinase [Pseudomonadota bacterium]
MQRPRVNTKLLKIFLFQVILISAAASIGIYSAALVAEDLLVNEALAGEADYFWQRYQQDSDASLPDTLNLLGYLHDPIAGHHAPDWLLNLPAGMQRAQHEGQQPIVHVSENAGRTLYLVFDEEQVSRLSFYFGIVPLAVVLLVLYALSYLTYLQAKRAISPIVQVAAQMAHFDINRTELPQPDWTSVRRNADAETAALVDAIDAFLARMHKFVARERNFTRYASHELRTPLAVIKGSLANLQALSGLDDQPPPNTAARTITISAEKMQRQLQRMDTTVKDMEALLETLLLLAREDEQLGSSDSILVNDVAALLMEPLHLQNTRPQVRIELQHNGFLSTRAPQRLVSIVLTNLLRNALTYTKEGQVTLTIDENGFSVEDTGIGIPPHELASIFDPFFRSSGNQEKGFGLGLAIVQKICAQLGWTIAVKSTAGSGTRFDVRVTPAPV